MVHKGGKCKIISKNLNLLSFNTKLEILYNKSMKETTKQLLLLFILGMIGMYLLFIAISPTKIEITPKGAETQARICKRTLVNPFNKMFISNVKQAVITQSKKGKYRLELEDVQGHRFPVTSYEEAKYSSEISFLQEQINNSIKKKTRFKYEISSGFMIILMAILALILLPLPQLYDMVILWKDGTEGF